MTVHVWGTYGKRGQEHMWLKVVGLECGAKDWRELPVHLCLPPWAWLKVRIIKMQINPDLRLTRSRHPSRHLCMDTNSRMLPRKVPLFIRILQMERWRHREV